jgi:S-adenosylmethionine uptake transporter
MTGRFSSLLPLLTIAIAVAFGCVLDAIIKDLLLENYNLLHIMALRYFFGAGIAAAVYLWPKRAKDGTRQRRGWPSRTSFGFQTLRCLILVVAAYLFFYSLKLLSLAAATALGFTAALMVPVMAWPFLGEKPSGFTWALSAVGLAGAVIAVSGQNAAGSYAASGDNQIVFGATICLISSALYAGVLVLLRLRAKQDGPVTTALFSNTVPALVMLPIYLATGGPSVTTELLGVSLLLGVIGYSMWFIMTMAYAAAPAQRLAPFEYSALIWASAIGFYVFGETPTWQLWTGGAIVIAACLAVAAQTHYATRKQTRMPSSDIPQ